jgi:Mg2+-importing ATPase
MFSAAGASFLLPFLPMTPVQILLTNGVYDISQLGIPSDNVDREALIKPRHWDINFIKKYMLFFGPMSSLYDFLTFGILWYVFNARGALFQTGWFMESIMTEILVVFVIRTARTPFWSSRPSKTLLLTCSALVTIALVIPYSPFAASLGFAAPPMTLFVSICALVGTYLLLIETMKKKFLARYGV